jgi:hypothetical protein
MTDFAEGSGSTWPDLDGDPRIVAGAEVLVGRRDPPKRDQWLGMRAVVSSWSGRQSPEGRLCEVVIGAQGRCRLARDLVCLRTADGELTEEGRALNEWAETLEHNRHATSLRIIATACTEAVTSWGARAGILKLTSRGSACHYEINRTRLAMALGREEASHATELGDPRGGCAGWSGNGGCCEVDARHCSGDCAPPAPVMCSRCGVQPISHRTGGWNYCADCRQAVDDCDPKPIAATPADYSGENYISSFRNWLHRPLGTK